MTRQTALEQLGEIFLTDEEGELLPCSSLENNTFYVFNPETGARYEIRFEMKEVEPYE